jgi:hypothetical protein
VEIFKFYSSLRASLIKTITDIQDSGHLLFDNTKSNTEIRYELNNILNKYLKAASNFGYYIVEYHFPCKNPSHNLTIKKIMQGIDIDIKDSRYVKFDYEIYNKTYKYNCACGFEQYPNAHDVVGYTYIDSTFPKINFDSMEYIFAEIYNAIECAGDKKPRSAIRERILSAILAINDEILPETMDTYIKNKLRAHES